MGCKKAAGSFPVQSSPTSFLPAVFPGSQKDHVGVAVSTDTESIRMEESNGIAAPLVSDHITESGIDVHFHLKQPAEAAVSHIFPVPERSSKY